MLAVAGPVWCQKHQAASGQLPKSIKVYINTLNDRAKTLPMPQLANAKDIHIATPVRVRVDINLQTGTVIAAKIESGHRLLNAAALRAAKLATFKPVLQEFPWVTGVGHISYRLEDFNKKTTVRARPLPLPFIQRDVLNSRALTVPKPDPVRAGKMYIAGRVEVAVLVDAMEGTLLASRVVSGPEELRATSEKAAMLVKFNIAHIDGDGSRIYVVGKIVYTFKENGKVE
jgi:outer membrane biosynthesis protein TonB